MKVSIDYIIGNTSERKFKKYKIHQTNFYEIIVTMLKNANLSQRKLCKDLNISKSNFGRWKNGTVPNFSTIIEISKYLNCNIDDILERE